MDHEPIYSVFLDVTFLPTRLLFFFFARLNLLPPTERFPRAGSRTRRSLTPPAFGFAPGSDADRSWPDSASRIGVPPSKRRLQGAERASIITPVLFPSPRRTAGSCQETKLKTLFVSKRAVDTIPPHRTRPPSAKLSSSRLLQACGMKARSWTGPPRTGAGERRGPDPVSSDLPTSLRLSFAGRPSSLEPPPLFHFHPIPRLGRPFGSPPGDPVITRQLPPLEGLVAMVPGGCAPQIPRDLDAPLP